MDKKEYLDFIKIFNKYEKRIIHLVKILSDNNLCYSDYEKCYYNDKTICIETSSYTFDYDEDGKYLSKIVLPYEVLLSDKIFNEFLEYKQLSKELDKGIKEPWSKEKLTKYLRLEKTYNIEFF